MGQVSVICWLCQICCFLVFIDSGMQNLCAVFFGSDSTVDAVEIKKLICQPIFFAFLPLTTLTIKSYSNPQFFFLLCCWHHWHLKKHKCVNQNFKSTFRWLSDAAIDTVDIKKLICQQIFFFVFLRLTPLTSKVHSHPNFFSLLCHWHHWHLKKHEYFKENLQKDCKMADAAVDAVNIKKIFHTPIYFSLYCCHILWLLFLMHILCFLT